MGFALRPQHGIVLVLRIVNNLSKYLIVILFYGNVLKFLHFLMDWLEIDDLFVVLSNFLDRVVLLLYHLSWDVLNDSLFMVVHYFSSLRHHLSVSPSLVINYLFLIRNVRDSAFAYFNKKLLPLTTWP